MNVGIGMKSILTLELQTRLSGTPEYDSGQNQDFLHFFLFLIIFHDFRSDRSYSRLSYLCNKVMQYLHVNSLTEKALYKSHQTISKLNYENQNSR